MKFIHNGLVASSTENAERFFGGLLGLDKTRESQLPAAISSALFGVDQDIDLVYYGNDSIVFEVFVTGWAERTDRKITHTCIEVADRADFLKLCREQGYEVREVPKGEKVVVFIADADGNLFEIVG